MKSIYILNHLEVFEDGVVIEETKVASKDPSKLKDYAQQYHPEEVCVTTLTESFDLCGEGISHLLITTLPTL